MKHLVCLLLIIGSCLVGRSEILWAQAEEKQPILLKTNLVDWATASPNFGMEFAFRDRYSFDMAVSYNPFTFSDNKKWRHILVEPELRRWLDKPTEGHFFGVHLLYAHYNAGGVNLPFGIWSELEDHRYEGNLFGAGLAYGYMWRLGDRWRVEASLGLGYGFARHKKYVYQRCGAFLGWENKHLFMPTKVMVSFSYRIN